MLTGWYEAVLGARPTSTGREEEEEEERVGGEHVALALSCLPASLIGSGSRVGRVGAAFVGAPRLGHRPEDERQPSQRTDQSVRRVPARRALTFLDGSHASAHTRVPRPAKRKGNPLLRRRASTLRTTAADRRRRLKPAQAAGTRSLRPGSWSRRVAALSFGGFNQRSNLKVRTAAEAHSAGHVGARWPPSTFFTVSRLKPVASASAALVSSRSARRCVSARPGSPNPAQAHAPPYPPGRGGVAGAPS